MDLTKLSLDNDRVVWTAVFGIILMGITTFMAMPRSESPPFTVRNAQIVTMMPGSSPERVELLVTDKLEKKIGEMPEVDVISSTSKTGISIITVSIKESYTEMRPIWDDLRRKVDEARVDLPSSASKPSVNSDLGDVYEVTYLMVAEGFSDPEMWDIAQDVRDEFLLSPEAAKVEITGEQDERVFIEYDNARLSELGLSPQSLQALLASQNITAPGGSLLTDRETIVVEPTGNYESVDEIKRTTLSIPNRTDLIVLGDIAQVSRATIDPPKSRVYLNGERALSISVSMRSGGNIIDMGTDIAKRAKNLERIYPIGVEFRQIVHVPEQVQSTVSNFVENLLQAVVVVLIVMLIFLGVRTGLVVVTLVPMTMLMTLGMMGLFGIGLNQVSLAALIIALGMLVDNSIVVSEAILVRMENGIAPVKAALESAKELRLPLLVSSLTTCAAFLPVALAESSVGEFTKPLFQVVTIALLCSWLLAMTMIPLFCMLFIKVKKADPDKTATSGRAIQWYRAALNYSLRHRFITIAVALIALVGSLAAFSRVPNEFFPPAEGTYFTATVSMPTGTPLTYTASVITALDQYIEAELTDPKNPTGYISHWGSYVGEGIPAYGLGKAAAPPSPDSGVLMINVDRPEHTNIIMRKVERFTLETFPDVEIAVQGATNGPSGGTPIQVRVYGRDLDKTFAIVEEVKEKLRQTDGTLSVQDNWGQRSKKLIIQIDQEQANRAGVSSQDIATSMSTGLSGLTITEFRDGDTAIPVTMRSIASERQDLSKLKNLNILSQSGAAVPLAQVADVILEWENAKRLRRDGRIAVTVSSELKSGYNAASVVSTFTPWLVENAKTWPQGYTYEVGGENEQSDDASSSIMVKLPIAALIILILLISQFNSIRRATIVLCTIPLALIGVGPGLYASGLAFGFMTLLGVISLAGIVINNAIVLLDRIRLELDDGKAPFDAIVEAASQRVRPIILTTITTICGMIPLYLGGGSMWEAMAMAIMAGLIVSTVLTLVVIPAIYATFYRVPNPSIGTSP